MSEAYIAEAKRHLNASAGSISSWQRAKPFPLPDESHDAVTSIFMFHELPPKVRRIVFGEFARVLKPGGRLVVLIRCRSATSPITTACSSGSRRITTSPTICGYIREDFRAIAAGCGLTHVRDVNAFVSKVMVFDKPSRRAAPRRRAKRDPFLRAGRARRGDQSPWPTTSSVQPARISSISRLTSASLRPVRAGT